MRKEEKGREGAGKRKKGRKRKRNVQAFRRENLLPTKKKNHHHFKSLLFKQQISKRY